MKPFIIFTALEDRKTVYPNVLEADCLDDAIEIVLVKRSTHQVVAFSYLSMGSGVVQQYTAIAKAVAPKQRWTTGATLVLK